VKFQGSIVEAYTFSKYNASSDWSGIKTSPYWRRLSQDYAPRTSLNANEADAIKATRVIGSRTALATFGGADRLDENAFHKAPRNSVVPTSGSVSQPEPSF
jgi:hypothetical protein